MKIFIKLDAAIASALIAALLSASGSAVAANRITQAICDVKNYLFEGAFIAAVGGFALTAALVWYLMDDDSKIKGKILTTLIVLMAIAAVPELLSKFGYGAC
jgi:hypothetical protein